jgi:two-component system NtrC family sensor kinase
MGSPCNMPTNHPGPADSEGEDGQPGRAHGRHCPRDSEPAQLRQQLLRSEHRAGGRAGEEQARPPATPAGSRTAGRPEAEPGQNHQHGQRAASIVKGMLEHSRTSTGERVPTDLNALADEYLRLAYQGLRAKDKTFNATSTPTSTRPAPVRWWAQTWAGCCSTCSPTPSTPCASASSKASRLPAPGERAHQQQRPRQVEIRVQDNGTGMSPVCSRKSSSPSSPPSPRAKARAWASRLSHDIIAQGHGGTLTVKARKALRLCHRSSSLLYESARR